MANIKKRDNIFIRMHTLPGEEAQVDFGYAGYTPYQGKKRKTWVFNMRLSYPRLDYYEVVYNQRVETFIRCHIHAFTYFGGIPRYVKIDNLKSAILQANFYCPIYQDLYKQFAYHYDFHPLPCRVRRTTKARWNQALSTSRAISSRGEDSPERRRFGKDW